MDLTTGSIVLGLVGIGASLTGLAVWLNTRQNVRRVKRMKATSTSRIADLTSDSVGQTVEIVGQVVPGPHGVFPGPVSGRPVVWCRVQHHEASSLNYWHYQRAAISGVAFQLDDGSGRRAMIRAEDLTVPELLSVRTITANPTAEVHAFFDRHGTRDPGKVHATYVKESGLPQGVAATMGAQRWIEDRVAPTLSVYAIGVVRAVGADSIELGRGPSPADELLLGTGTKTSFATRQLVFPRLGLAALGFGMAVTGLMLALAF